VPLFQEQAMRLAVVAAGFTPGEADQLRRAMGAWRRPGIIEQFRQKLIQGMLAKGLSQEFADQVVTQSRGFGEYGVLESHSVSFALLVYISSWLKCYHPAAFAAALLNSQPMGFYAPAQLVRNARDHDVTVRPIDVNFSRWDCTLEMDGFNQGITERIEEIGPQISQMSTDKERELTNSSLHLRSSADISVSPSSFCLHGLNSAAQPALRLGLRMASGLQQAHAQRIEAARREGPFLSLDDFTRRTR